MGLNRAAHIAGQLPQLLCRVTDSFCWWDSEMFRFYLFLNIFSSFFLPTCRSSHARYTVCIDRWLGTYALSKCTRGLCSRTPCSGRLHPNSSLDSHPSSTSWWRTTFHLQDRIWCSSRPTPNSQTPNTKKEPRRQCFGKIPILHIITLGSRDIVEGGWWEWRGGCPLGLQKQKVSKCRAAFLLCEP